MKQIWSAQGGQIMIPNIQEEIWKQNNQGYTCNVESVENYILAKEFIYEKLNINSSYFNHYYDCWYYSNNCHIENRGGHRFIRPSNCAKFVLQQGMNKFYSHKWSYSYHGTSAKNVKSILINGLKAAGDTLKDGTKVKMQTGNNYGKGIYTSKIPLYAQIYAEPIEYKNKYLQCLFMVRQDTDKLKKMGQSYGATQRLITRSDVYRLYNGHLEEQDTQNITFDSSSITLQAILIKVHDKSPQEGEYKTIEEILDSIDNVTNNSFTLNDFKQTDYNLSESLIDQKQI